MPHTDSTAQSNSDSTIQVAKITSRQAIIVALITSLAGVLGGLIGHFSTKDLDRKPDVSVSTASKTPEALHLLSIEGVTSDVHGVAVRIVADVNGQAYSYPSRVIWASVGSHMSTEQFPLAPSEKYRVHFSAYTRSQDGRVRQFESQEVQVAAVGDSRHYKLFGMEQEHLTHTLWGGLEIVYQIR